jgi:hypothetical protein
MPYKNKEDRIENRKEYYEKNKEDLAQKAKKKRKELTEEERIKIRERRNAWYENTKEERRLYFKERKHSNKKYLIEMLGGKCLGCGVTENLQFDHIDRTKKLFCIGKNLASKIEKLIEEANKCQLLCEKCHQHKTLVNHDCNNLAVGKRVVSIETIGNKTIVTLEEVAQDP